MVVGAGGLLVVDADVDVAEVDRAEFDHRGEIDAVEFGQEGREQFEEFEHVVPYLMLNRDGLDVLVHPLTTDAVEDHSGYAIWLGNPVELKLHTLPHGRGGQLPSGVSA